MVFDAGGLAVEFSGDFAAKTENHENQYEGSETALLIFVQPYGICRFQGRYQGDFSP